MTIFLLRVRTQRYAFTQHRQNSKENIATITTTRWDGTRSWVWRHSIRSTQSGTGAYFQPNCHWTRTVGSSGELCLQNLVLLIKRFIRSTTRHSHGKVVVCKTRKKSKWTARLTSSLPNSRKSSLCPNAKSWSTKSATYWPMPSRKSMASWMRATAGPVLKIMTTRI